MCREILLEVNGMKLNLFDMHFIRTKRRYEMKLRSNRSGFTLIEVVVVIAVIAILAAILAPSIVKHIDDSKIAKAQAETKVIGSVFASFYKDVGQWPRGTGNAIINLQTVNGSIPTATGNAANWARNAASQANADFMRDHFLRNRPKGGNYPATGSLRWRGPYQSTFTSDPWGNKYLVNIGNISSTNLAVWVISAGPDGRVTTPWNQGITGTTIPVPSGDDIGYRVK